MGGPLPAKQALDRAADVHALRLQQRGYPGRKSPKRAVRRPPRPYKRAIERERSLWETRRALKSLRAARTVVQQRRLRHQPGRAGGRLQRQGIGQRAADLGFGRIVASEIEAPNMFVNML